MINWNLLEEVVERLDEMDRMIEEIYPHLCDEPDQFIERMVNERAFLLEVVVNPAKGAK